MSKRRLVSLFLIAFLAAGGIAYVEFWRSRQPPGTLTLYGNVDIREVHLAFNASERITTMLVHEGDVVRANQLLAELQAARYEDAVRQAAKRVETQRQILARLLHGSRPEEILAARAKMRGAEADVERSWADVEHARENAVSAGARVEQAHADIENARTLIATAQAAIARESATVWNARREYDRRTALYRQALIARSDLDQFETAFETARAQLDAAHSQEAAGRAALRSAQAQLDAARAQRDAAHAARRSAEAALDRARRDFDAAEQDYVLAVKGPRREDIDAARATLQAEEAALALAQRQLHDTRLYAPADGIIEERVLEPGDMASSGTPVFTLALVNPVWVRAYVPEPDLGKIALGMRALAGTDSFPGKAYPGWVGYISPTAEFTPKRVETPELRTRLVYQVRVYVCNTHNELRLGMPATVTIPLDQPKLPAGREARPGCSDGE